MGRSFVIKIPAGNLRLYIMEADDDDNYEHIDRFVCVHVFGEGAESNKPNGTMTTQNPERVWRWEMCKVCHAMYQPNQEQRAEQDFQNALIQIMDNKHD